MGSRRNATAWYATWYAAWYAAWHEHSARHGSLSSPNDDDAAGCRLRLTRRRKRRTRRRKRDESGLVLPRADPQSAGRSTMLISESPSGAEFSISVARVTRRGRDRKRPLCRKK